METAEKRKEKKSGALIKNLQEEVPMKILLCRKSKLSDSEAHGKK